MDVKMKYLLVVVLLLGLALVSSQALAGNAGCGKAATGSATMKSTCSSNPIGDTIDNTPSIKEMQSKPSRGLSYTTDVLGNKIPTQTDNSGKR